MMFFKTTRLMAVSSAMSVGVAICSPTHAAQPSGADTAGLDEIVVTARKREEKLLDVPVAVVGFSAKNIEEQSLRSLADLAAATPGLSYDSTVNTSGRNDRSFPQYIIRGIVPSTTNNPTTTIFVDGAPIVGGQVEGLDDLERIEVLQGPQSAYFGRETFAGAINLVTRDPANTFGGSVSALLGDPNYYDTRVSLEGPIVSDKLTVRATYRYYSKDGSYRNQAGDGSASTLGDQSTQSGSLAFVAKPVDNLRIKGLYTYWQDRDGPSAQYVVGPSAANCLGGSWFCGTVPRVPAGQPAANTVIDAPLQAWLEHINAPGISIVSPPDKFGLRRNAYHWSLGIDYDIPSLFTISSLTAADNQEYSEIQDLDNVDTSAVPNPYLAFGGPYGQSFWNYPFLVAGKFQDFSQEFRLTSDQNQRFRWLVGISYAWAKVQQTLSAATSFSYDVPATPVNSNSAGVFYGLSYDLLPKLTLSFEGRYQRDEQHTLQGIRGTFKNYTPRAILQYKFTPDIMGYVTYSQGVNPGTFNALLLNLPPDVQATLQSVYGAKVVVGPEKLKNYEIGLKGRFLDNTLTVSGDVYYDDWTDQINVSNVIFKLGDQIRNTSANVNNGIVHLTGLEGSIVYQPIPRLELSLSGAVNKTDIRAGACALCGQITGNTDVTGNELPNVSKYQAAVGVQYGGAFVPLADWDWFVRLDDRFKTGSYASADNLVKSPNLNLVNLRAGLTRKNWRVEGFVENLTNTRSATNITTTYNIANPFETYAKPDSLLAGLPVLRTYGIRAKFSFGGASQ